MDKRINAGYEIIYSSPVKNYEVVLGRNLARHYVTWLYSRHSEYFWGHYFDNEADALEDLAKRIREENNNG